MLIDVFTKSINDASRDHCSCRGRDADQHPPATSDISTG